MAAAQTRDVTWLGLSKPKHLIFTFHKWLRNAKKCQDDPRMILAVSHADHL